MIKAREQLGDRWKATPKGLQSAPAMARKNLEELFLQLCEENVKFALLWGRENPGLSVRPYTPRPSALEVVMQCPNSKDDKEAGVIRWIVSRHKD